MYWNRKHVLVCTANHCMQKGANTVAGRLRLDVKRKGLDHDVLVNTCDSIDLCDCGPNIVVYPEQVIFSGVTANDIKDIVGYLQGGPLPERLVLSPEAPAEVAREQFYREVVGETATVSAEEFEAIAARHDFDEAWIKEQARRGFIGRKEIDGVPSVTVTSKALNRYRIDLPEQSEG